MRRSILLNILIFAAVFSICSVTEGTQAENRLMFQQPMDAAGRSTSQAAQDKNAVYNAKDNVISSRQVITDFDTELEPLVDFIKQELFRNHGLNLDEDTDGLGSLGEEIINPVVGLLSDAGYLKELVDNRDVSISREIEGINNEEGQAVIITSVLKLKDDVIKLTFMPVWERNDVSNYSQYLYSIEVTESSSEKKPVTKGIVFDRTLRSWETAQTKKASITYSYTSPGEENILSAYARGSVQPLSWDLWYEASGNLFITDPHSLFGIW